MADVRRIKIFVASPGDVREERSHARQVIAELDRELAPQLAVTLDCLMWEDSVRPGMGRMQGTINDQVGSYDVFVGIMWRRFGTPTGVAESGSQEEFQRAFDAWSRTGRPKVMFYFSQTPAPPPASVDEAEQLVLLARFREDLGAKGLYWVYDLSLIHI